MERLCDANPKPRRIRVTAYEIDNGLADYLEETCDACRIVSEKAGISFEYTVQRTDFVVSATHRIRERAGLFPSEEYIGHEYAILNPPYRKISSHSAHRLLLRSVGIEVPNLYAGFVALSTALLRPGGEIVAITPRSFCNGAYFRRFRKWWLSRVVLRRIHVFDARDRAFRDDAVLQENIVTHAVLDGASTPVLVSTSQTPEDLDIVQCEHLPRDVASDDSQRLISLAATSLELAEARSVRALPCSLADLGLCVSTGRVVPYRVRLALEDRPDPEAVPLLWPGHVTHGAVRWPSKMFRKPQRLQVTPQTEVLIQEPGTYVVVRRLTAKEEDRRIVAAVLDTGKVCARGVAIENHLNVIQARGGSLSTRLALGLSQYLNSAVVDTAIRQLSGSTQINASDLRRLRYPALSDLEALASQLGSEATFDAIDDHIYREILNMANRQSARKAKQRIKEAQEVLKALDLPAAQRNERSALALLALLGIDPADAWSAASNPLVGITQMMEFFAEKYGRQYAPNTRETVRRETIHQFVDAGIAVRNPDDANRPVNSPKTVYQIEPAALQLLRQYGSRAWRRSLRD